MWPRYDPVHVCVFRKAGKSREGHHESMQWVERCRCGRIVDVIVLRDGADRAPTVRKAWYDNEGNLVRRTGDWPEHMRIEQAVHPLNSSPESGPKAA